MDKQNYISGARAQLELWADRLAALRSQMEQVEGERKALLARLSEGEVASDLHWNTFLPSFTRAMTEFREHAETIYFD
jgi:hypothetical protein